MEEIPVDMLVSFRRSTLVFVRIEVLYSVKFFRGAIFTDRCSAAYMYVLAFQLIKIHLEGV